MRCKSKCNFCIFKQHVVLNGSAVAVDVFVVNCYCQHAMLYLKLTQASSVYKLANSFPYIIS